jgi:hypothetical protein
MLIYIYIYPQLLGARVPYGPDESPPLIGERPGHRFSWFIYDLGKSKKTVCSCRLGPIGE